MANDLRRAPEGSYTDICLLSTQGHGRRTGPARSSVQGIRRTAGEDRTITDPPPPPSPPPGDPTLMHVGGIDSSLNRRGERVIDRMSVVNGGSAAVSGVTVNGAWSGMITGGDSSRTTDAGGVAISCPVDRTLPATSASWSSASHER